MTGEHPVPDKADKFPARQMSSPIAISIHKVRCRVPRRGVSAET